MATLTDSTLAEDFQQHHDSIPVAQISRLPRQGGQSTDDANPSFDDEDVHEPESSPSDPGQHLSDSDEVVFDNSSRHTSPSTSQHSDDDMSEFPHELQDESILPRSHHPSSSPYTPYKMRSPFRNPSSVRAIQMDTTPPSCLTSSQSQQLYSLKSASRNGTPRSMRSQHSVMRSPSKISPTKKVKKEYPLVLLHVTLLPIPVIYPAEIMESVLPTYILENWKLLQEKATDTVLARGILIPHPKEDYDLLEERLLESLELKLPRILKCGHFHLDADEANEAAETANSTGFEAEDYDSDNDVDMCSDCGRRIRDGRFGSGTGRRRWDIKLYAANGLMRAGAWSAAWREMERVDVEITPWMTDDMKRDLELRREEEENRIPEAFHHSVPNGILHEVSKPPNMDDARMREIYGDNAQPYIDGLIDNEPPPAPNPNIPPSPQSHRTELQHQQQQPQTREIPLPLLLRNYLYLASKDPRNITIFLLSLLVLFLSLRTSTSPKNPPLPSTPQVSLHHHPPSSVSSAFSSSLSAPPYPEPPPVLSSPTPIVNPSFGAEDQPSRFEEKGSERESVGDEGAEIAGELN